MNYENDRGQFGSGNKPRAFATIMNSQEKLYWRRKLPVGFQFYLERLTRSLIRGMPDNLCEFAAVYLEEKLVERNVELQKLPDVSYFDKLKKKYVKATQLSEQGDFNQSEPTLPKPGNACIHRYRYIHHGFRFESRLFVSVSRQIVNRPKNFLV